MLREGLKTIGLALAVFVALGTVAEIGLRLAGLPTGHFASPLVKGLYPRNASLQLGFGVIPYTVKTNTLGFRGEEIELKKSKETFRIVAVGDSATDGFFVENDETYPYYLQKYLRSSKKNVEVVNAAAGGGSIDKQLHILRSFVLPLEPDAIVLTFVTNDIFEILGKSREELLGYGGEPSRRQKVRQYLIGKTAVGEWLFSSYLKSRSKYFRNAKRSDTPKEAAMAIAGGLEFSKNVQIFNERFGKSDGLLAESQFPKDVEVAIGHYFSLLEEFRDECRSRGIRLMFSYFPSYPEVYGPKNSRGFRDLLFEKLANLEIPSFDLTTTLRSQGQTRALHFAPLDYHLNAAGNEVVARAVGDALIGKGLLPR